MAAQAITKALRTRRPRAKLNNTQRKAIADLAKDNPALTHDQLAALNNVERSTITRTLAKYHILQQDVIQYKEKQVEILEGLQARIIKSCTDEDIKKAPFGSRILAVAQLIDKVQVLTGGTQTAKPMITINIQAGPGVQQPLAIGVNVDNPVDNPSCQPHDDPIDV